MSDFIVMDFDYIDCIKNDEDLKKVERLRELIPQMKGVPWQDCIKQIMEFTKLDRELRGMPPAIFVQLSENPTLN
jgi:hypothetical protein